MKYSPTSYNLLWFLTLNATDAHSEKKIETFRSWWENDYSVLDTALN